MVLQEAQRMTIHECVLLILHADKDNVSEEHLPQHVVDEPVLGLPLHRCHHIPEFGNIDQQHVCKEIYR